MCTGVFVQDRDGEEGVEDLCVLVCLCRTGMGREVWRIYVYWCVCSGQGWGGRCGGSMCTGVFVQDRDGEEGVEDLCVLVCLCRTGMGREVWRIYVYWCVCVGQG